MVRGELFDHFFIRTPYLVHIVQGKYIPLLEHPDKSYKDLRRARRVVHSPVMILQRHPQSFRHRVQFIFPQ